jgi:Nucleotidyl transferase AbiEii toxin, Type IV TA system
MRLHEHPDFRDAIIAASSYFAPRKISPQLIEKDYYATETLRTIADRWGAKVIFKGGTSLSKGWDLIDRFSEDIDLFLNKQAFSALFPTADLAAYLREQYTTQCRPLCYGDFPDWQDIIECFESLRSEL